MLRLRINKNSDWFKHFRNFAHLRSNSLCRKTMSYFTNVSQYNFFVKLTTGLLENHDLTSTIIRFVSETYCEPRRRAGETRSDGRKGDDTWGHTRERNDLFAHAQITIKERNGLGGGKWQLLIDSHLRSGRLTIYSSFAISLDRDLETALFYSAKVGRSLSRTLTRNTSFPRTKRKTRRSTGTM